MIIFVFLFPKSENLENEDFSVDGHTWFLTFYGFQIYIKNLVLIIYAVFADDTVSRIIPHLDGFFPGQKYGQN